MTIHTFEASATVTKETYHKIQQALRQADCSKWKALNNGMLYWGLSNQGIFISTHRILKKDYTTFKILYRISARRVIEHNNFVGLFNVKNYAELEEEVDRILKSKCELLPKLKKSKLRRLDFCVNAKLDNQEQVKTYIKTMKRANIPTKLNLLMPYDSKAKRRKPLKDCFTLTLKDYVEVSIYNKYMEMKKEEFGVYPEEEMERAKNIVRIELRCMKGKIKELKKKYGIDSISEFMSHGQKIGQELYKYYLTKIANAGMICTLKEAKNAIDLSEYRKKTIKFLKEFVTDCNSCRSVAKCFEKYRQYYSSSEIKRFITLLDDIDTNYVTITNEDKKVFDDNYIPTPYELYQNFVQK